MPSPEGAGDFLGKLHAQKTPSWRCLLLGSQGGPGQALGSLGTGRDSWLGPRPSAVSSLLAPRPRQLGADLSACSCVTVPKLGGSGSLEVAVPYPVAATPSAFSHPMGFACDLSVLLGPGWPGCCVRGAKKEVGNAAFAAGISSGGPGVPGSPWEAALGSFLLAEPCFAGRGRRGCLGPMDSGTPTQGLKRNWRFYVVLHVMRDGGLTHKFTLMFSFILLRNKVFLLGRVEVIFILK